MIDSREEILYIPNSIQIIIEAVVTNNVGYKPIRHGYFEKDTKATLTRKDGTIIKDYEYMNLILHLEDLSHARVIPRSVWNDEYQRRLPLFTRMEAIVIDIPPLR
jgi:hypothetical protein